MKKLLLLAAALLIPSAANAQCPCSYTVSATVKAAWYETDGTTVGTLSTTGTVTTDGLGNITGYTPNDSSTTYTVTNYNLFQLAYPDPLNPSSYYVLTYSPTPEFDGDEIIGSSWPSNWDTQYVFGEPTPPEPPIPGDDVPAPIPPLVPTGPAVPV
jgi:hypothetical protein